MASSGSMDDEAFAERVKKTFGSLFTSIEPSSLSNPLWSLTGTEVEKKEWRRDKDTSDRDSNPCSSEFHDFISDSRKNSRKNRKNYRKELEDDLDDGGEEEEDKNEINGDPNDWDVRSSIGLDSTLDNEEEEDTYDKVALGRENAGDRLYMSDVTDNHDSHFGSQDNLPSAIGNRQRDPRANRLAAKVRLNEDDVEAVTKPDHKPGQAPPSRAEKESPLSAQDGNKPKPILKRKEHETSTKPSKRVRFDPGCISEREVSGDITSEETRNLDNLSMSDEKVTQVPDYVQNPSKYTCYSLDSTKDMDCKSNTQACLDFVEVVKRAKNEDDPIDLPKSVTFVPKRKSESAKKDGVDNESPQDRESGTKCSSTQSNFLVGISSGEEEETEVGDMEVDEPEPDRGTIFHKQRRQYRSKSSSDEPA